MSYDSVPTPTKSPTKIDPGNCRSIDWYSEGESRINSIGINRIEVRFVGRRGRRSRIAITAPSGAIIDCASGKVGTHDPLAQT